MKKPILLILTFVLVSVMLAACSAEITDEDSSTTVVTDGNGATQYYEIVTDDKGETYLTPVTGAGEEENISKKQSAETEKDRINTDDNEVPFDLSEISENTVQPSTEKATQATTAAQEASTEQETKPVTDADGWINKWY